jgi:ribosomal protein L19
MSNFIKNNNLSLIIKKEKIPLVQFKAGDILKIVFFRSGIPYTFEGICLSVKKKGLQNNNSSFLIRNVLEGIGVEYSISYFYNRMYFLQINDYKKKFHDVNRAKFFFIRKRLNRESQVK